MVYLKIKNIKQFMGKLFAGNAFDDFYVTACDINIITQINITAKRNREWNDEQTADEYCRWSELKEIVYNLIKGSRTPSLMKIVFADSLSGDNDDIGIMTLKFEDDKAVVTTGFQSEVFSLDRSDEKKWDNSIVSLFEKNHVIYEYII